MTHPFPPNLWQGIQLAQAGHKAEALPYLRYAARHENLNAEGWLWLASASDDREEYRHCVQQALGLDPAHPVARQMRQALDAQDAQSAQGASGYGLFTPAYAQSSGDGNTLPPGTISGTYDRAGVRPRRSWRRLLGALVLLLIVAGLVVGAAALLNSGALQRTLDELETSDAQQSLDLTVGSEPGFRFRMTVPSSWLPANTDNATWRAARDTLAQAFGLEVEGSVWQMLSASFSTVVRDPVYGRVLPSVRIVETEEDRLRTYGAVTALTLHEIPAFPADVLASTSGLCDRIRAIEDDYGVDSSGVTVLNARTVTREGDDNCALVVERAITDPSKVIFPVTAELAPQTMREVVIAVPVGQERFALWRLTLAEEAAAVYADDIDRLIDTLEYVSD